jgi:hypothetical protein
MSNSPKKTTQDVSDMIESNALAAIDQRKNFEDSVASHARNVLDTLVDWGWASNNPAEVMAAYYIRIGELLRAERDAWEAAEWQAEREANEDMRRREGYWEDAGCRS